MKKPLISIIIPCRNEEKYITSCLESIINGDMLEDSYEILVVDGLSTDRTIEIVDNFAKKYKFIKLLENQMLTAPYAMNLGINSCVGDFIFIVSAHAEYSVDYFSGLVSHNIELNADCTGGVWLTKVINKNIKSNSIIEVLQDKLGVGNAEFRLTNDKVKEVDTAGYCCYRRSVFEKFGLYDVRLTRNQDIELNKRIKSNGGKIYLIPKINCTYYARDNFLDLSRNNYNNGYWNILTVFYTKNIHSLSIRHFIPLMFLLSLLLPLLLSLLFKELIWLSIAAFTLYSLLVSIRSYKLKKSDNSIIYLIMSFFVLHLSYGFGSFCGLFKIIGLSLNSTKNGE